MDTRIPRIRRKLAAVPFHPHRSHSFGEERHRFRLGPTVPASRLTAFEDTHAVVLPNAYRQFLLHIAGSGAAPFYGLSDPTGPERPPLYTMDPPGTARGFSGVVPGEAQRDLFLHIIEMGCTDMALIAVTGPLTGRIVIGNSDGFWGPNVSSARDFLGWYERWLDHMTAGKDNRALELTSPALRAHPERSRLAPLL
ncbi:SMI1/KNR4 family protein [Streptomyces sp. SID3343]|uniref:SMI1/KNR4 family protein n=1 Tax=Streptomyces sp. SID3343 TaxID=2690260 RepID=UPI001369CFCA|nr:SMI1/KNR4 family protein [Streptomyces sp. SID3343]